MEEMNNEQKLSEIKAQIEKVNAQIDELKGNMYDNSDYEAYEECNSDEEREEKFSDLFNMHAKIKELDVQKDNLLAEEEKIIALIAKEKEVNEAKERYIEIDKEIEKLEAEIESYRIEYENMLKDIREKDKTILALKATKEYQDGDEETVKKVEKLSAELDNMIRKKNVVVAKMRKDRKTARELEKEKTELIEKYGKEIVSPVENKTLTSEEASQNQAKENKKTKVKNSSSEKNQRDTQAGVVFYSAPSNSAPSNSTPSNKEMTEKVEKNQEVKFTKGDFNKLFTKAKKGNLSKGEYNKLIEIMQDPSKYDEYGITTGVVFNKSKSILKALARNTFSSDEMAKQAAEKLGIVMDEPGDKEEYISSSSLKEWKGLRTLMENPGKKIASEEIAKKVVKLDRESLNEEQQVLYDKAVADLAQYDSFRKTLQTCKEVSLNRAKRRSWLYEFKEDTPAALGAATEPKSSDTQLAEELAGKVVKEAPAYVYTKDKDKDKDKVKDNITAHEHEGLGE